jgi:hypothetical protein
MAKTTTKPKAVEWTEAEARRVLAAREASGLSIWAYAAREGVKPQRLYWWTKRLATAADSTTTEAPVRFVPAIVNQSSARLERVLLVVRVGSNARLEIAEPSTVPAKWIAEVLTELERIACS